MDESKQQSLLEEATNPAKKKAAAPRQPRAKGRSKVIFAERPLAPKPEQCPTCGRTEFRVTPMTQWMIDNGFESAWVCSHCYPDPSVARDVTVATVPSLEPDPGTALSLVDAFPLGVQPPVTQEAQELWDAIGSAPERPKKARWVAPVVHQVSLDEAVALPEPDHRVVVETRLEMELTRGEAPNLPAIIDRSSLPGGRIPPYGIYVGRGANQEHPWICPYRIRKGTPEERAEIERLSRQYIEERLRRESGWLEPLRGKALIVYGDASWATLLREYSNG